MLFITAQYNVQLYQGQIFMTTNLDLEQQSQKTGEHSTSSSESFSEI